MSSHFGFVVGPLAVEARLRLAGSSCKNHAFAALKPVLVSPQLAAENMALVEQVRPVLEQHEPEPQPALGGRKPWRSCRGLVCKAVVCFFGSGPGKVAWDEEIVRKISAGMAASMPRVAVEMIENGEWKGGAIVRLDRELVRPSANDVILNACLLKPVLEVYPEKVSWRPLLRCCLCGRYMSFLHIGFGSQLRCPVATF